MPGSDILAYTQTPGKCDQRAAGVTKSRLARSKNSLNLEHPVWRFCRTRRCDGFELITEQDVAIGRRKVHAIHVHFGWRRLLVVGLNDLGIDGLGLEPVPQDDHNRADNEC